jgi:hypothetical protein
VDIAVGHIKCVQAVSSFVSIAIIVVLEKKICTYKNGRNNKRGQGYF